jgi:two-component system, NarL family, sensor histidine kinase DegS
MDFNDELLNDDVSPQQHIIDMINDRLNTLRRRLQEIRDQIESMHSSVEREQGRYSNIATELRGIKDNLDTTPREDIRDKYDEALDVRFRLATMRGQLEKFESTYDNLEQEQTILSDILSEIQGTDFSVDDGEQQGGVSRDLDIVGIVQAQEEERKRLARAMHDGPAQSLTNFILQAEIVQRFFERDTERAVDELNELKSDASKTFQKVRDFIFDLRPMMLDDLGAAPTVRRYVESFRDKNEIDMNLEILGDERRLESYIEVMIFRSIQDVMTIARDYASATEIGVTLDMGMDVIKIKVDDNGKGFNTETIFNPDEEESYTDARGEALLTLKGRVELIQGEFDIQSDENDGTIIYIDLPTS